MFLDKDMMNVLCDLEFIIGGRTRNPNSSHEHTREELYRYPIKYCENKSDLDKSRFSINKGKIRKIDPECIGTMKYEFGSNHLFIGTGLLRVLEYLEDRYDISFNDMEFDRKYNEE